MIKSDLSFINKLCLAEYKAKDLHSKACDNINLILHNNNRIEYTVWSILDSDFLGTKSVILKSKTTLKYSKIGKLSIQ